MILHVHPQYASHIYKILKEYIESLRLISLLYISDGQEIAYVEKWCKFVKNHFFSIIIIHAHLQYVWNMSAKYWKEILKALGGVDFTNYALPTIFVYMQW